MAEFTSQQKAVLTSAARHNLVNAISKTGKTQLLIRIYLNWQEQPGEFKAVFLTSNGVSTQRVTDQLQRITRQDWSGQLIGTFSEIGYKLVQRHYADLKYSRIPKSSQILLLRKTAKLRNWWPPS
jgi:superfamily I DNA/RNA helicase